MESKKYKIMLTGTKPMRFGSRKVLPGETAIIDESHFDRSNHYIKLIEEVVNDTPIKSSVITKLNKKRRIR